MRGRDDRAQPSFRTFAGLMLLPATGLVVFLLWSWLSGGESPTQALASVRASIPPPVPETLAPLPPIRRREARPSPSRRPRNRAHRGDIVLIIDDLGFEGQSLERLMSLDPNMNFSILPNGSRAAEFAERLNARGYEILCHLPMEPRGEQAPGRNAILTSMSNDEIARATRENLESVPYARGVNNHMGSRATTDRRVMSGVLGALPEGIYFIDSRTTGGSVAGEVARQLNVRTATRNVFLDDDTSEAAVRRQLASLARTAEERGMAIGIGHPYPVTLRVLANELPELRARGFRLVRASEVVR